MYKYVHQNKIGPQTGHYFTFYIV